MRKDKGFTQEEMAKRAGIGIAQFRRYEGGKSSPTLELIKNIAKTLAITTDELIFLLRICLIYYNNISIIHYKKTRFYHPSLKFFRRIKKIETLPPTQQNTLLKTIDTFIKAAEK